MLQHMNQPRVFKMCWDKFCCLIFLAFVEIKSRNKFSVCTSGKTFSH